MPRRRLQESLEDLERELERAETLDAAARQRLDQLLTEARRVLEASREDDEEPSLLDRLREATREFEEEHPALAETVGRLATALSNMGI